MQYARTTVRLFQFVLAVIVLSVPLLEARADLVAFWTFETSIPTTAGPYIAEAGVNAGVSQASGFHASGTVTYSNPVGNGSSESFSSDEWSTGDYYQFTTSTIGFHTVTFGWDQTSSGTGPLSFKVEADFGSGFVDIVNPYAVGTTSWASGSTSGASVYAPVALGAAAAEKLLITVRLTSLVDPADSGTNRVDNVMFNATAVPEPTAALFGGLVCGVLGLTAVGRRYLLKSASA